MANIMVIGASRGLGRAFVEGLASDGDKIYGVSRTKPEGINMPLDAELHWIAADMAKPLKAAHKIAEAAPQKVDTLIYNLGVWEEYAFEDSYQFEQDDDAAIIEMISINITSTILLLKHIMPKVLNADKPQVIITGSTSGLRQSGRPEVTFGASKHALTGIADALREGYRKRNLAVTCLQLGDLNTDDALDVAVSEAAKKGEGRLIPVHDVVAVVRTLLQLSPSSFVRELTMPAILDDRF
ncbi:SDR family oxidoreductase [Dasania marina]|uniref:SDR family oxidoreductase n=1 Tax=Dasania marina TaxID=471499 RepID=UPI0030D775FA|tara:strand:- start:8437 stop:9156 length:720 start_codon:yes stop_codon:yes gene_type:complete